MNRIALVMLCGFVLNSGCATTGKRRVGMGILSGASVGASGAALLSPNPESRALNALVFGLVGALVGGSMGYLSGPAPGDIKPAPTLEEQERARLSGQSIQLYQVAPKQELPEFVRQRLAPVVVEEFTQQDQISEDGTLHEPHRVYRIKRQPQLNAKPSAMTENSVGVAQ